MKISKPTGEKHTTKVGNNIFLDLGFSRKEAVKLKYESDIKIKQKLYSQNKNDT